MIKFSEITVSLGTNEEGNAELEKKFGWEKGKISSKTGINRRFISKPDETSETLALKAVSALEKKLAINDIDCIISTTNTQTNIFPALAYHILLDKKFKKNIQCFGLNVGCTGFVDALSIAYSGIASKLYKKVLIVTSDTYSKFIREEDQSTRPLFSDGATATLVEYDKNGYQLQNHVCNSVPNTLHHLCMMKDETLSSFIQMNGPNILTFAIGNVLPAIKNLVSEDEDYTFYPHQAGKLVLDTFEKKLPENISIKKNYAEFGNLVSGSIPNLIIHSCPDLNLQQNIIFSGFGVGLAHSSLIFKK